MSPELTQLCVVQIILLRDVQGIGKQGELAKVVNGYWCVPLSNATRDHGFPISQKHTIQNSHFFMLYLHVANICYTSEFCSVPDSTGGTT